MNYYRIAEKLIDSKGFDLADEAKHVLENYITNHCQRVDGNGRYIRNMVEEIIRIQSNRLYEQTEFNEEGLLKIKSLRKILKLLLIKKI